VDNTTTPVVQSYVQWMKLHFMSIKTQFPQANSQELLDLCRERYEMLSNNSKQQNKPHGHQKITAKVHEVVIPKKRAESIKIEEKTAAATEKREKIRTGMMRRKLLDRLEDMGKPKPIKSAYEMYTTDYYQRQKSLGRELDIVAGNGSPSGSNQMSSSASFTEHYMVLQQSLEQVIHAKRTYSTSHAKRKDVKLNYAKDIIPESARLWNAMSAGEKENWMKKHEVCKREYAEACKEWDISLQENGLQLISCLNIKKMDRKGLKQTLEFIHKKTKHKM